MSLPIDHLVYAVPDLTTAMNDIEQRWGVRPTFGGQHATGTHNALLALGPTTYLEIIALDPAQHDRSNAYFGLNVPPTAPNLRTWAARTTDVQATVDRAVAAGYVPGDIRDGGRLRPDGVRLSWRNTIWTGAWPPAGDGLVPFLIEWGAGTPHPAGDAPVGCRLVSLRAEHPDPDAVRSMLAAVGVDLAVAFGPIPALMAEIETPNGRITLK